MTIADRTEEAAAAILPMVRLDRITKTYPGTRQAAVHDLSLDIREGEIFALLGPSGCGKTTTLRIVAGLESPDGGTIHFKDRPIVVVSDKIFVPPERREVGMVFQSYAIWPHMTVEENVAYPLRVRRVPDREAGERVAEALALVGLQNFADRPAPLLSGGQQQRVALARALVYKPNLLLLDEPFSNLDTKLREQMRIEVKLLQARLKVTVLFVTHDQVEALSLANRIAVMNQGVVQQVGDPHELYERPANAFVRDFLGKTIVLRGEVRTCQGGLATVALHGCRDAVITGRAPVQSDFGPGQEVYLALRPEEAALVPFDGMARQPGSAMVPGTVEAALYVGERTEYRVRVQDQGSILLYGDRSSTFGEGQSVFVAIPPDAASIWPAAIRTE